MAFASCVWWNLAPSLVRLPTTPELRLLLGWIDDATQFDWLFSPPILEEYRAVLRRLKVPVHTVGRFLNLLRQAGIEVEARDLGSFSPDPDDDPFYHCAIAGHADAIVTDNVADFPPGHWFRLLQINQGSTFKPLFVSRISAGGRSSPPTLLKPLRALDGSSRARGRNYAPSSTHLTFLGVVLYSLHTYWYVFDRPHSVVSETYGRLQGDWHESL
jgi:hypothetical protein